jgi:hypothetical protein
VGFWRCLLANIATVPRFFCNLPELGLTGTKNTDMLFNEKYINNADLIIPFERCSFGKSVEDCPFKAYWNRDFDDEGEHPILTINNEELEKLRDFHRNCMLEQVKRVQEEFTFE